MLILVYQTEEDPTNIIVQSFSTEKRLDEYLEENNISEYLTVDGYVHRLVNGD